MACIISAVVLFVCGGDLKVMDYETADFVVREIDGVTIVRLRNANLTGSLEIQHLHSELDQLLDRGVRKIILDFKYVKYASSAALGLMIAVQKRVNSLHGKIVLSHSENISELLRVSKTASLFILASGPKEAMAML